MAEECRIRILPEEVATKIAAGEVVERPASVVKELAENAVDAGATRLTVEVEEGGRRLLRVTDNGCGMTAQEAVLALQRHATSKIRGEGDLRAIRTLGFRGEALPSIAAVSRLTLITRPRGAVEGSRLEAEAGEIQSLDAAGAPEGTSLLVRDLFYNVPARLKFLKTPRTELTQICDALVRLALAQPQVAVRLVADGNEALRTPGDGDLRNAVAAAFGAEAARDLLAAEAEQPGLRVSGFVGKPTLTRPTRSGQLFFVNGRTVRAKALFAALDEAFRATMPAGRFPLAVLKLAVDPELVDVNVHPTKAEVRFLREGDAFRAVRHAVGNALGAHGGSLHPPLARQITLPGTELAARPWAAPAPAAVSTFERSNVQTFQRSEQGALPELHAPLTGLRAVAQLWRSYIAAEGPEGLLIVDQHLAHERILYHRLERREAAARLLPAPATLQMNHREAVLVDGLLPELTELGFEVEPFGRDGFLLRAAPDGVDPDRALPTLKGIVATVVDGGERRSLPREQLLAAAACQAAIKKGQRLGPEEQQRLLEDLARTPEAHRCPHGYPVAVEITYQELLRRFKRV